MKKIIFLLLMFVSGSALFAQNIQLGFTGGSNYSILPNGGDTIINGLSVGYNFGLLGQFKVAKKFYLMLPVNYERKILRNLQLDLNWKHVTSYYFLSFSLPLKYVFGKKNNFHIYAGPYLNYLLKQDNKSINGNGELESYFESTKYFPKFMLGFITGGGYMLKLGNKTSMFFDVSYCYSKTVKEKDKINWTSKTAIANIGLLYTLK